MATTGSAAGRPRYDATLEAIGEGVVEVEVVGAAGVGETGVAAGKPGEVRGTTTSNIHLNRGR